MSYSRSGDAKDANEGDQSFELSDFDPAQHEHNPDHDEPEQHADSSSSLHFSDAVDHSNLESEAGHSIDEREMRRQLNDVESSFLPESIPAHSTGRRVGADDTYVNMGSTDRPPSLRALMGIPLRSASSQRYADAYEQETTRRMHEQGQQFDDADVLEEDPGDRRQEHDLIDDEALERRGITHHDEQSDLPLIEIDPSSPAAAAAHRNQYRNAPSSSSRPGTARLVEDSVPSRSSSRSSALGVGRSLQRSDSSRSSTRARSPLPQDISLPPSEQLSTAASTSTLRSRPTLDQYRQISHASSYGGRSDLSGSDATISADYALHTGGAAPSDSPLAPRSNISLSRLPSLGSVVSVMSKDEDAEMPAFNRDMSSVSALGSLRSNRGLGPLNEEQSSLASSPTTPRAASGVLPGITDTAITRHVQNIRVPDTVAQEFRQRERSFSPDKRPFSSSTSVSSRPQSNLTLKEQNSRIDKLTKENFDLKLKIHFLDQALQNRSDEGVKDMINKNVQVQTDLANERKESQALRRRIRELEKKQRELEEELAETKENAANTYFSSHQEMEIEINELRQQLDFSQVRITKLSAENLASEVEKRKMAEHVAAMRDRPVSKENPAADEADMWKDLLETETARREQAEDDARKLKEELALLKAERSVKSKSSLRPERREVGETTSWSEFSEGTQSRNGAVSGSSVTLVEQLRLENIELRRDLSAQTSMLTSRNKERERLQQEIEDLKMTSRKGGGTRSITGDSILERSASRARQRSQSRISARTGTSQVVETEREEYERREGFLRDQSAQLKLDYRDLEREAQAQMDYISQLEVDLKATDDDLASAVEDLKMLQKERDDALRALEYRDTEYEKLAADYRKLEEEALVNIEGLEDNIQHTERSRQQLTAELRNRNEDFAALQQELRSLGSKMLQIEDDREASLKRIQSLEQELEESIAELDTMESRLRDTNEKSQRLEVMQESLQGEITFLREEQESDKVKIGDLQNSLSVAQQAVQDERDKMQELEEHLLEERRQRDTVDNQSKEEVQRVINELNDDNTKNKDEVRKLRRNLSSKENEAQTYRNRLEELENSLRHVLGDLNGSHTSLLQDIGKLQDDLEATAQQLDDARATVADRERLIRNRDALLENTGLETQRLSDLLEKERQSRKHDQHQHDQSQRGSATHLRVIANHETKIMELETARSQDRRKINNLEHQYREQLDDRDKLLLALWKRLSTLCGTEWVQQHSLINGEIPSVESISRHLTAFNRNIVDAVKQIEALVGGFKTRIRTVEKSLRKDYQTLEHILDARVKRMDFLERSVQDAQAQIEAQRAEEINHLRPTASRSPSIGEDGRRRLSKANTEEMNKLRIEVKSLKAELKFHRQHPSHIAQEKLAQEAAVVANRRSSTIGLGASSTSPATKVGQAIANKLLRHHSTSAVDVLNQAKTDVDNGTSSNRQPIVIATPPIQPSEQRWVHRLKELERRLKAEREARLLDRRGARQRLDERSAENEELKAMLERERERRGSAVSLNESTVDDVSASQQHTAGAEMDAEGASVQRRQRDHSVD